MELRKHQDLWYVDFVQRLRTKSASRQSVTIFLRILPPIQSVRYAGRGHDGDNGRVSGGVA